MNTCSYYISMHVGGLSNRLGNKHFEKHSSLLTLAIIIRACFSGITRDTVKKVPSMARPLW